MIYIVDFTDEDGKRRTADVFIQHPYRDERDQTIAAYLLSQHGYRVQRIHRMRTQP